MSAHTYFINAVGTALDHEEQLHAEGMRQHLEDQWANGIDGVLVAGTMGVLQLLRDETYQQLAICAAEFSKGRGEVLVGAGDASFARTRQRIEFLNGLQIDGTVVLSPYFIRFSQSELIDYYRDLADLSIHPIYLYHLPGLTHAKLEWETVERIAEHTNIRGIKCSCDFEWTRELMRRLSPEFRVIVAEATRVDELAKQGVEEHLDGIFSLAPQWLVSLGQACRNGNWKLAAEYQSLINRLLEVVQRMGVFPSFSAILNARGIEGCFAPRPFQKLDERNLQLLLEQPIVKQLIAESDLPETTRTHATSNRVA